MIKQRSNCVVNLMTGGGMGMTVKERVKPAATFKPEVASLNMGTMNFGYPMLAGQEVFKFDWEKPYLEATRPGMFKNTFADIEYVLTTRANNGGRFKIECYSVRLYPRFPGGPGKRRVYQGRAMAHDSEPILIER